MYPGISIGNYAKNTTSKEDNSGTSMRQMELLREKGTICGILKSSVIPRMKLSGQILFFLIKERKIEKYKCLKMGLRECGTRKK